jgi:hypothetical protein
MRGAPIGLALLLLASAAAAQDSPEVRAMRFAEKGGDLVMSGSFTDVFDRDLLEQLASGFSQTVVFRAYVYRADTGEQVWFSAATYRAVYAHWDEEYAVRLRDPAGERNLRLRTRAEALRAVTTLEEFPVAPLHAVEIGKNHFVGVVVEVNPVAPELLAEVRRWLSRPRAGQVAGDASFFGSFVSVFVNPKLSSADRTLRVRSQELYRVRR